MKTTIWIFVLLILALGIYSIVQTPFFELATTPPLSQQKPSRESVVAAIATEDNGPLQECSLDTRTYYVARGSVFDGSDNIYDDRGVLLAQCGGGWGVTPEPYPTICTQLSTASCTDITQAQ